MSGGSREQGLFALSGAHTNKIFQVALIERIVAIDF
jgi:hypothetical protein